MTGVDSGADEPDQPYDQGGLLPVAGPAPVLLEAGELVVTGEQYERHDQERQAFFTAVLAAALGDGAGISGWARVLDLTGQPVESVRVEELAVPGSSHVVDTAAVERAIRTIAAGHVEGLTPEQRQPLLMAYFRCDPDGVDAALAGAVMQVAVYGQVAYR